MADTDLRIRPTLGERRPSALGHRRPPALGMRRPSVLGSREFSTLGKRRPRRSRTLSGRTPRALRAQTPRTLSERPARAGVLGRLHAAVLRIDAATSPGRDRAVDALRALSILGVVLGHWLVTGVVLRADGHLLGDSPLREVPALTPLSWLLQPLAIFFFVGGRVAAQGYAAGRTRRMSYGSWLAQRLRRLSRPVVPLLSLWLLVLVGMVAAGTAHETVSTLLGLVVSPLWFLAVFALLTAATPLVYRHGALVAILACGVVALLDVADRVTGGAAWVEPVRNLNVLAGWLVPYALGAVWAAGGFTRRRYAAALFATGTLAMAGLILWGGYPASMVGVPGSEASNLSPVSLAAVSFGTAQCGAALLLCRPLRRLLTGPSRVAAARTGNPDVPLRATPGQFLWAAVALLNLSAITVFLWHQTAMLAVTTMTLGFGHPLFGLHTPPDAPVWAAARLAWIPVFTVVLIVLAAGFRHVERGSRPAYQKAA
ncbi:acyltransferase family protein [Streptomyces sp. NPDC001339]|uniref:acyltransferase family protein n=1 Tax=Streptomyces sp. NPDC001339 TaxID=3364563 RepID=UPI0036892C7D